MIAWLNPVALWGLLAAVGAVAVHLLTRQRAIRLPFASVRFIRAASTAAIRIRRPADAGLLLIRVATLAAAAFALAQPLLITSARRAAWDDRVARAIVVDRSRSMTTFTEPGDRAAAAEARSASHHVRLDAERLPPALAAAREALAGFPPSRREIVVISDFQRGSLTASDVATVPTPIGLRFLQVGPPPALTTFEGGVSLAAPGVSARVQQITATPEMTRGRLTPVEGTHDGLRLSNAGGAADALLRAVARAGAPAPSREQPMSFLFIGASPVNPPPLPETMASHPRGIPAWMVRTIVRMRSDTELIEAARDYAPEPAPPVGMVVARNAAGAPVVTAVARDDALEFVVAAGPMDFLAAAAVRAALVARRGTPDWSEHEAGGVPSAQLSAWSRPPAPLSVASWRDFRGHGPGDARSVWLLVLILLGLETIVRRNP